MWSCTRNGTHTLACDLQLCKTNRALPTGLIVFTSLTVVTWKRDTTWDLHPLACDLQLCKTNSAMYTALIVVTWKRHTALDLHPSYVTCNCARQTVQCIIIIIIIALIVVTWNGTGPRIHAPNLAFRHPSSNSAITGYLHPSSKLCHNWLLTPFI